MQLKKYWKETVILKLCDADDQDSGSLANTETMIVVDKHEQDVLCRYRANKETQRIVDKILDLDK